MHFEYTFCRTFWIHFLWHFLMLSTYFENTSKTCSTASVCMFNTVSITLSHFEYKFWIHFPGHFLSPLRAFWIHFPWHILNILAMALFHLEQTFWIHFLWRFTLHLWKIPLKMLHARNLPSQQIWIPRYLAVQIQIEILNEFEFVPWNLSFWIWWVSGT